jgi:hypothetical protein
MHEIKVSWDLCSFVFLLRIVFMFEVTKVFIGNFPMDIFIYRLVLSVLGVNINVAPLFTHYCVGVTTWNNNILTHN